MPISPLTSIISLHEIMNMIIAMPNPNPNPIFELIIYILREIESKGKMYGGIYEFN